jgi:proline iminopeptidase
VTVIGDTRETMLQVPGARLYVREAGSGTPLLVLHGGPDFNHHALLPDLDRLSDVFRLVYYDQRGRGKSSPGVEAGDVSIESEVADLERIRVHAGVDRALVLAHSWGCVMALEWATRHPEQVLRLLLVNPPPPSYDGLQRFMAYRAAREAENLVAMREIGATPGYAAGDIETEARANRLHFAAAVHDPAHLEPVVQSLRVHFTPADLLKARAIEERLHEQTWSRPHYDLVERMGRLETPTLVIHGRNDFIPIESAEEIAHAIPGADLRVFENCGHFAYMEQPERFRDAVVQFVGGGPEGLKRRG